MFVLSMCPVKPYADILGQLIDLKVKFRDPLHLRGQSIRSKLHYQCQSALYHCLHFQFRAISIEITPVSLGKADGCDLIIEKRS